MKKSNTTIKMLIYIFIALFLSVIVIIRLMNNKETVKAKVYLYDKNMPINVQADTLELESLGTDIFFTGTFEPNRETKISAETQGKIDAVYVDAGSSVKRGQPLIQLDNSLLKLQLQSVEVQMEGIESDIKRYTILANADAIQGVQLEKAELAQKSAIVQRSSLIELINKTTIRAPFNGIITAKLSEEGSFAAPGVPLLQITDISTLKFTINVSENDLGNFRLNSFQKISVDAFVDIVLSGKTLLIGSKANTSNSYPIQFSTKNTPDLSIKSGMFGKLNLKNEKTEKQIIIPTSAIVGTVNNPQVYLAKNGIAVLQNISILKRVENKAIIKNGLAEGDVLITNGFINLFEKANVIVKSNERTK